jgi:predicted SAM-dependent methyltransferase
MNVHLGAFDQLLPGWVNTDITPHLFIARVPGLAPLMGSLGILPPKRVEQHRAGIFARLKYVNVAKRLPFGNSSVGNLYSSHMFEHLTPDAAMRCMEECLRVLMPEGVLRIAVPDLDQIVRAYDPENPERMLETLFELKNGAKNRHWWHYNEQSLTRTLRRAGFRQAYRCEFRQGRCSDIEIVDSRAESLFVEAVK